MGGVIELSTKKGGDVYSKRRQSTSVFGCSLKSESEASRPALPSIAERAFWLPPTKSSIRGLLI